MSDTTLSPDLARQLDDLRAAGHRVFGPGPMTPGQTTPTADAQVTTPGMHVQIGDMKIMMTLTTTNMMTTSITRVAADPMFGPLMI